MKAMSYKTIIPGQVSTGALHAFMLASVAPRPIALVSTIDDDGNVNLSPFSFFNIFGSNPPVAIVSPARRVRDNTTKHTLDNVRLVPQLVINVVNYAMVQQTSLSSCEYPKHINEFTKAGFTELASEIVKPPRVAESPVQLECSVVQVIETGQQGGAGNLIVCHIERIHIQTKVLDASGKIDQHVIDLVGRLGDDWYVRASGKALFAVPKPNTNLGIGIDQLPVAIKHSKVFTGNHLAALANISELPAASTFSDDENIHKQAVLFLEANEINKAWEHLVVL